MSNCVARGHRREAVGHFVSGPEAKAAKSTDTRAVSFLDVVFENVAELIKIGLHGSSVWSRHRAPRTF